MCNGHPVKEVVHAQNDRAAPSTHTGGQQDHREAPKHLNNMPGFGSEYKCDCPTPLSASTAELREKFLFSVLLPSAMIMVLLSRSHHAIAQATMKARAVEWQNHRQHNTR